MEHGLRPFEFRFEVEGEMGLNPYCNGTWSPTQVRWVR